MYETARGTKIYLDLIYIRYLRLIFENDMADARNYKNGYDLV